MATDVIMPALGVAQEKGTLLNWRKAEGQPVTKGEPLMEIETDKATVEIEAAASGILANVSASPGDEVPVGHRIAVILAPGETAAPPVAHGAAGPLPEGEGRTEAHPLPESESRGTNLGRPPAAELPPGGSRVREKLLASPAAKRIAKEKNIDLASLKGSGPQGAVIAADISRAHIGYPLTRIEPVKVKERLPISSMRRTIAERMSKSKQSAPHFYVSVDVDMSEIRKQRSDLRERRESPVASINDYIIAASARSLRDIPQLNAAFNEGGIEMYADINIGMAVALEEGLVVPVIRNADRLSLEELATKSREFVQKAQSRKLFPSDFEGGTFTVSNLGMFGIESFIAIINPPQAAILAIGRVAPRVIAVNDRIVVRSMMTATLSADHRIVDGALAARFVQRVKALLEAPDFH